MPAKERGQQAHAVIDDARDDLLGVERGRLLAEIDVAVDFARRSQYRHVGDLVRIRERPKRRAEAEAADRLPQLARRLEPVAVGGNNIGADLGILTDVAVIAIADLDFVLLRRQAIKQRPHLRILAIDERDHLEQPVERDRDRGRTDRVLDHFFLALALARGADFPFTQ